jgi:hypothetical protein
MKGRIGVALGTPHTSTATQFPQKVLDLSWESAQIYRKKASNLLIVYWREKLESCHTACDLLLGARR